MRTMINILPPSYRRQLVLRNRGIQWATAIAAVLVAGWAWHWLEMREHAQLAQQLDVLSREHAPTRTMLTQLIDMRRQLTELDQQVTVAKELETQRNVLTLLGVISDSAQEANGRLRVTKLELNNFQNPGAAAGAVSSPLSGLVLSGVSLDNPSVAKLLEGLQQSGIFSHVELLKLKEREDTSLALRDYEVRCEF